METMFKLTRRKGSAKWQVRKRWPADVAGVLNGEFNASTGEEDKKLAQQRLPMIAAEYEGRVAQAREKLAQEPRGELTEAEAHRMAAEFYRASLPAFVIRRQIDQLQQRQLLQDTRARLATLKEMLGRQEYGPVLAVSRTLTGQAGIALPDESPAQVRFLQLLMRAFVELHAAAEASLSGDTAYKPQDGALRETPADADLKQSVRTMEALLKAYEVDKAPGWSGSTKKAVVPVFRVLRDVFPGRPVDSITRDDARAVVKLLEALPANLGKRKELAGLKVPEAVEKSRGLGLPVIGPKTINDGYLLHIASLFNWARKEQWITSNPFEGMVVHDPVSDAERRDPFTPDQLATLFSQEPWAGPWKASAARAGAFWVPLLCLYHGLRLGEAVGLRVVDVAEDDEVPVLHIRPYEGRALKTKDSRGTLPLHPEMTRLGFLAYVQGRRDAEEALLFPEGVANSRGQIGAKVGERFSQLVKRLGFTGRKLGMHSFRHNYEDRLRAAELPERTALALARRSEPGSSRVYGDGLSAKQKAAALKSIAYPGLDLTHLYPEE